MGLELNQDERSEGDKRRELNSDNPAEGAVKASFEVRKACFDGREALVHLFNYALEAGNPGGKIG